LTRKKKCPARSSSFCPCPFISPQPHNHALPRTTTEPRIHTTCSALPHSYNHGSHIILFLRLFSFPSTQDSVPETAAPSFLDSLLLYPSLLRTSQQTQKANPSRSIYSPVPGPSNPHHTIRLDCCHLLTALRFQDYKKFWTRESSDNFLNYSCTIMASSKDQPSSRPASGSFSRPSSTTARQHSHSISLAPTNPSHRVNRRKSVITSTTAQAAIAAALREQGDASVMPLHNHRRSLGSRKTMESQSMSARPSMHSYFHGTSGNRSGQDNEALEDNSQDEDLAHSSKSMSTKPRNRRASDGSYLIKGEGKKSGAELRCDTCGKGYKHSSCLTKHL